MPWLLLQKAKSQIGVLWGQSHLVKYVYLADLGYAQAHGGETYTGIPWRFHHFGPWHAEVFRQIEPALVPIGGSKISIQSRFTDDYDRWSLRSGTLAEEIEQKINFIAALAVKDAVRQFGSDTEGLLHFVYNTKPMLSAAPEDILNFMQNPDISPKREAPICNAPLTKGQLKRLETKKTRIKEELGRRYAKRQEIKRRAQGLVLRSMINLFLKGLLGWTVWLEVRLVKKS